MIPLSMLQTGKVGEIVDLIGNQSQLQRLAELGLGRGSQVQVIQKGSPCIVRFGDTKLCFRDSELLGILVKESN